MGALRGATTVAADETLLIHEATLQLLTELLSRNDLTPERIISAIFTVTPDLRSEFPARAAREIGFHEVPMICAVEMAVPGALARCIRVLLHVTGPLQPPRGRSVYLRGAAGLRPDLTAGSAIGADSASAT
jgi:chorismate mutase